ncbi:MAG: ATP-binding cassette domain-containing protein [Methanoregulaceae archaeon]|nr:MAG: ATP-binding cassette domain-containing protein [Methanoregulaceae archaeon]
MELKDLSATIGDFRLDRISLSMAKGEYVVLLGPSGAGKTVLLEIIAGIRVADQGKISINGKNMDGVPPEHRGVALVYQDYSLFSHMTVARNVAYGMSMQKTDPLRIPGLVDELLTEFGISALRDRYPGSLSGGEQQRVALARALATKPSVLLLDEPFASLDPQTRKECIRVLQDLRDTRSVTILQVSHSPEDAYALADRTVVLLGGKITQTGSTDEIFRYPKSEGVAKFVGMENILSGSVIESGSGHSRLEIGIGTVLIPADYPRGSQITIGIPADCITVVSPEMIPDDPMMNIIDCQIRRVTCGRDIIIFELDGPIPLTSAERRSDDREEVIQPGKRVFAVFRSTDVRIFSGD